jgi:hypothetical protein
VESAKRSHFHTEINDLVTAIGASDAEKRESGDGDTSLESAMEGKVGEFVRRDFASVRRPGENDGEMVANNISSLLQRVSGASHSDAPENDRDGRASEHEDQPKTRRIGIRRCIFMKRDKRPRAGERGLSREISTPTEEFLIDADSTFPECALILIRDARTHGYDGRAKKP